MAKPWERGLSEVQGGDLGKKPWERGFAAAPADKPSALDSVKRGISFVGEVYGDAVKREDSRQRNEGYARANEAGKRMLQADGIGLSDTERQQKATAEAARSKYLSSPVEAVSEVVRQGVAGAIIDAPAAVNKAGQAFSPAGSEAEKFFKSGANYWEEDAPQWEPNTDGKGALTKAFASGARSIPLSGMAMAGAGVSLLGGSVVAPVAVAAGIVGLFGGSQFTATYEKVLENGGTPDEAFKAGLLTGGIEAGGETVGGFVGGKFLTGIGKAFIGSLGKNIGTKEALTLATDPRWAAKFGAGFLKNAAVQSGTEAGQGFGQTAVENRYGVSDESPFHVAAEGAKTALAMTVMMGGGGIPAHKGNAEARQLAGALLADPNAPVEDRAKAAEFTRREMEQYIGKSAAKLWHEGFIATTGLDKVNAGRQQESAVSGGDVAASDFLGAVEVDPNAPTLTRAAQTSAATQSMAQPAVSPTPPTAGTTAPPAPVSILPDGMDAAGQAANQGAAQTDQPSPNQGIAGIVGSATELVLPDNTSLPAQWEVVDADQITATLKEGVNQPRDRSRAASNTQVQGIANKLNYTLLRDSPVMDFGAPTLSQDGSIVAGNGRFEGVSRAYDQGMAGDYKARLIADLQSKGIDPASIEGMKKPVLVRRVSQPADVRALAVASNSGGSLQYSALEQAKIDGDRMTGLGDVEISDTGDVIMSGANMLNVRRALAGYTVAELGSLTDKDGGLSQDGIRRFKNALLYKAYGNSSVLSRIVESADPDMKSVMGAMVRAAGTIAEVRADMEQGNKPIDADVTQDLLGAVELLSKIKSSGMDIGHYLSQEAMFGREYTEEAVHILGFLANNLRSQKRMAEFLKSYYDGLSNEDYLTGSIFDAAPISNKERLSHAAEQANQSEERPADSGGEAAPAVVYGQDQQQPENAPGTNERNRGGQQDTGIAEADARAAVDRQVTEALADLGAIARDHAGVARMLPEDTPNLMPTLVKLFDAGIHKVGFNIQDLMRYVKAALKEHHKTLWNKISNATYLKAAQQAIDQFKPDGEVKGELQLSGQTEAEIKAQEDAVAATAKADAKSAAAEAKERANKEQADRVKKNVNTVSSDTFTLGQSKEEIARAAKTGMVDMFSQPTNTHEESTRRGAERTNEARVETPAELRLNAAQKTAYEDAVAEDVPHEQATRIMNRTKVAEEMENVTGFYKAEDKNATVLRAIKYAKETGGKAYFIDADVANLGGLNEHFKNDHGPANAVYRDMANIAYEELQKAGNQVMPFRHGGDEFSFVVIGGTPEGIDSAIKSARVRITDYAVKNGLDQVEHPKHRGALQYRGIGVYFGQAEINGEQKIGSILKAASAGVDAGKKGGLYVGRNTQSTAGNNEQARGQPEQRERNATGDVGVRPERNAQVGRVEQAVAGEIPSSQERPAASQYHALAGTNIKVPYKGAFKQVSAQAEMQRIDKKLNSLDALKACVAGAK